MDSTQTIILFFLESVFFIGILTACLVSASKKHRNSLKEVVEQVNKSKLFQSENSSDAKNNKELLEKLKDKISKLQNQISMLEKIEKKYYVLKDKYNTDTKALKEQLAKNNADTDDTAEPADDKKNVIAIGTTLDKDYGVEPSYLNYLSQKKQVHDADQSTSRSSHEVKALNDKLLEQRAIIKALENDLKKAEMGSEIESIKNSHKEEALQSLKLLEESLTESQSNGQELESSLAKLRKELESANGKISMMEMRNTQQSIDKENSDQANDNLSIEAKFSSDDDFGKKEIDAEMELALRDYEKIKMEVETLRANTTQQRQLIFTLEKEIIDLRKDLSNSDMTEEEKSERELHINKLERLLKETESCVDVLESEVSYLQDKLTNYDESPSKTIQEMYEEATAELSKTEAMLERATNIRACMSEIIRAANTPDTKEALDNVSKKIMATFAPLDIAVHLKLVSQFGEIDASNSKKFAPDQLEFLSMAIHENMDTVLEAEAGFLVVYKKVGVFVQALLSQPSSLGKLKDTINFIMLVSNSVVGNIEERQSIQIRQAALKRLVEGVKSKIGQISVQSKYQSDEAKNIFDGLVKELNTSLNTMNVTETQSQFFNQMIEESKQRMSLLLASEVVVDKSFSDLLDKVEKSSTYLQK